MSNYLAELAANEDITVVCGVTSAILRQGTGDAEDFSDADNIVTLTSIQQITAFKELMNVETSQV